MWRDKNYSTFDKDLVGELVVMLMRLKIVEVDRDDLFKLDKVLLRKLLDER